MRAGESQREREGEGGGCQVGQLGSGPIYQWNKEKENDQWVSGGDLNLISKIQIPFKLALIQT
jgi:hypothetical protein